MKNKFIFFDSTNAIIEDFMYYTDHADQIDQWLDDHNSERTGMIIKFCNEQTKTLFILTWL